MSERPPADPAGVAPIVALPSLLGGFALDALIGIVLVLALQMLAAAAVIAWRLLPALSAGEALPDPAQLAAEALPEITIAAIVATLPAALLLWWLRGRRGAPWATPMHVAPAYGLAVVAGAGIQAACLAIGAVADASGLALDPSNAAPIAELGARVPWLAWAVVVLVAPLGEELLFRHVLLRRFAFAGRGALGLLATALPFALLHELDPTRMDLPTWLTTVSLYLLMGLGFGAVYLSTRRFGAAFAAHATCNLLAMLLLAFSPS